MRKSRDRSRQMSSALAHQVEEVCTKIGNEVADEYGFAPIRNLLARFQIRLISRPLLVEGMLATIPEKSDAGEISRWAVLLDSEAHNLSAASVEEESRERPLPSRMRNTIAHELVHSLAFRPNELGMRLLRRQNNEEVAELVAIIEQETERLSPLLLFSEKALQNILATNPISLSIEILMAACSSLGISRYVLINRLRLLKANDAHGFLERKSLRNVAIGLIEWQGDSAVILNWPLFINYERNVVPTILLNAIEQDRLTAGDLGFPEASVLCGGTELTTTFLCDARVKSTTKSEQIAVTCEVEPKRRPNGESLFLIRMAS